MIIIFVVVVWNSPILGLSDTIRPVQILGPIYRHEAGPFYWFYVNYKFINPGKIPVEITKVESTILLNGTDYGSQQTTHELATVQPGARACSKKELRTISYEC